MDERGPKRRVACAARDPSFRVLFANRISPLLIYVQIWCFGLMKRANLHPGVKNTKRAEDPAIEILLNAEKQAVSKHMLAHGLFFGNSSRRIPRVFGKVFQGNVTVVLQQ